MSRAGRRPGPVPGCEPMSASQEERDLSPILHRRSAGPVRLDAGCIVPIRHHEGPLPGQAVRALRSCPEKGAHGCEVAACGCQLRT
jgi:hypothetical protein